MVLNRFLFTHGHIHLNDVYRDSTCPILCPFFVPFFARCHRPTAPLPNADGPDAAVQQILALTTDPDGPSLLGRLCWCQCQPIPRPVQCSSVAVPCNLAGVTLQYGAAKTSANRNHVTAGSLESLRWATYDAAGAKKYFIEGYQPWYTGSWSEPAGDPIWCFLFLGFWTILRELLRTAGTGPRELGKVGSEKRLWLARVGNATYEPHGGTVPGVRGFQFSEDFQQAEIIPKGHFGWADGITRNYMVQADSSVKGDHWERFQGLRPVFQKMIGATSQKERR
ncbi:EF-hand domain-containing protein [Durusdinium trenchii]|uniref:EF-hand domain-containing protein n=1 Tax=Durusdinium trenchii TaxID=1381693 RepID=A0ABP0P8Y4_9DINO